MAEFVCKCTQILIGIESAESFFLTWRICMGGICWAVKNFPVINEHNLQSKNGILHVYLVKK